MRLIVQIIAHLLAVAQEVVDGVDDDADDPVLLGQDRLAQIVPDDTPHPFGYFFLVKEDRRILLVAARLSVPDDPRSSSSPTPLIAVRQLARKQGRSGELRDARDGGDDGKRRQG